MRRVLAWKQYVEWKPSLRVPKLQILEFGLIPAGLSILPKT
jgi:hypothetical protein